MNYNNNQTQIDSSYEQMNNIKNNNYLNNYGLSESSQLLQNNTLIDNNKQANLFGNISNDNLINIANSIDPNSFNGTQLNGISFNETQLNGTLLNGNPLNNNEISKIYSQKNKMEDNKSLIKSLTKEIINNLKENNMSLYDNSSINSRGKINKNDDNDENFEDDNFDYNNDFENTHSNKSINSLNSSKKSKKNKKKEISDFTKTIENFVVNNETPNPTGYIQWFFDDCFNYKDFLILFILYFVLSQEMIKDFFARYFTSLNSDDEGKIGIQGVIIYGLILTILFMIIKKLL